MSIGEGGEYSFLYIIRALANSMNLFPAYTHYFSTNNANLVNNSITKTPNETCAKISIKLSKAKSQFFFCF